MYKDSLVQSAKAKTIGSTIHSVLTLCSYYRNACEGYGASSDKWSEDKRTKVLGDINKYVWCLARITETGQIPNCNNYIAS